MDFYHRQSVLNNLYEEKKIYIFSQLNIMNDHLKKQRSNCPDNLKIDKKTINRILKLCNNGDIFGNMCVLWNGYVNRSNELPLYFKKTKKNLIRLLYINFVDDLKKNQYLKRICGTKKCICLNHYEVKKKKPKIIMLHIISMLDKDLIIDWN